MSPAKNSEGVKTIVNKVFPSSTDLMHLAWSDFDASLPAGFTLYNASVFVPGIHTHTHAFARFARGVPVTSYTTVISSSARKSAGVMTGSIDSFAHAGMEENRTTTKANTLFIEIPGHSFA